MTASIQVWEKGPSDEPVLPAGYRSQPEDAPWHTVHTPDGRRLHAWCACDGSVFSKPTQAAYVFVTSDASCVQWLTDLELLALNVWTFAELRADATEPAASINAGWPDQRKVDSDLAPIPDGRSLVSLRTTMAGLDLTADESGPP